MVIQENLPKSLDWTFCHLVCHLANAVSLVGGGSHFKRNYNVANMQSQLFCRFVSLITKPFAVPSFNPFSSQLEKNEVVSLILFHLVALMLKPDLFILVIVGMVPLLARPMSNAYYQTFNLLQSLREGNFARFVLVHFLLSTTPQ